MESKPLTRRTVIKQGLAGIFAYAMAPSFVPSTLFGRSAPSNRINLGLIGTGLICSSHMGTLLGRDDCRIIAACDVNREKAEKARDRIEKAYGSEQPDGKFRGVEVFQYHEQLLARDDIDAVFVCTPDHWHVGVSHAAMVAGKDVYCEKPLTLTVREGRFLVGTARRYGRVLQTGTQQRADRCFRRMAEIVRNGLIGDIKSIRTRLGEFPPAPALAEEPIPASFDYDRWLGPTPWRPYNAKRVLGNYGGGWRCFYEYGGRKNGDWGAHHFDIIQWVLDMDASGPVEFIPKGYQGTPYQTHVYANGLKVERVDEGLKSMIEIIGTKGTVWASRGEIETSPADLATRALRGNEIHVYTSDNHESDFLNCVRTRQRPICDVEVGHRSATVCHLNNIAEKMGRPIRWDPVKEEIVNDAVAARYLDRPRRAPYALG